MSSKSIFSFSFLFSLLFATLFISCKDKPSDVAEPEVEENEEVIPPASIENLLKNQIENIIVPKYLSYQEKLDVLLFAVETLLNEPDETSFTEVQSAYSDAYLAYQACGLHNYYATANLDLVKTTNLYPVDTELLNEFIETESYFFSATSQQRANGFPALDYFFYGLENPVHVFSNEPQTATFLKALVESMKEKADLLVERWTGDLKENFINNGGVELGSSMSVQLNESLIYYEDHIRENKVGLPIGKSGPHDTPFDPDPKIIEAYYQSLLDGNDNMSLKLLGASIEEMEDIYLGTQADGSDGVGYEDLLRSQGQESLDADIKAQFEEIYFQIDNRTSILGDETLYNSIQALVTLYKSDLFPILNVQDADGLNDGD